MLFPFLFVYFNSYYSLKDFLRQKSFRVLLKFLIWITVMNLKRDLSADATYSSSVKSDIVAKDEKILEK